VPSGGVTLPGAEIARMIAQVDAAIMTEHSNYTIRGAELCVGPTRVQMTATDSHRMARAVAAAIDAPESVVLIPKAALSELVAMLSDDADEQAVNYLAGTDRHVFTVGTQVLITRALEGKFPNVDRLIPSDWVTRFVCDRESWVHALNRIAVLADPKNPCVTCTVDGGDLVLSAQSVERGDAVEKLRIETEGEPVVFKVKPGYLRDFLVAARSKTVACETKGAGSLVVLKPADASAESYLYVVAQMTQ